MTTIHLNHIKKAYGDTVIMDDMNFTIEEGERLVLLGPSGCGKSTILRMIAGFEDITDGELLFDERVMNDVAPGKRDVAMVFQNYALYPHMSVKDNITYGLRVNNVSASDIETRLNSVLGPLSLEKYLERKPAELSGGQRQRVALARATVKNSDVFLLDEPLSNLDAQLRVSARKSLIDIHQQFKHTMIYVTHDQIEAMTFGDRIALLNFGELQQIDTPENIYRKPANIFTARFIGNPPMNVLSESKVAGDRIRLGNQEVVLKNNWKNYLADKNEDGLVVGIRPESIRLFREHTEDRFKGTISHIENYGFSYAMFIDVEGTSLIAMSRWRNFAAGDTVYLEAINDQLHFFNKKTTKNVGYPENILEKIEANALDGSILEQLIQRDDEIQRSEKH